VLQVGVLAAIPWQSLLNKHGQPTVQAQYVGALIVERSWGRPAAIGITVLVLVTAFASLYGNLLGFSRISYAAARDGAFLPIFARLHARKEIPHVALFAIGALSLAASIFTLDQVIAFLTAGIVLIQAIAQIVALAVVRFRGSKAPFAMPLYPLPALIALAGWIWAFVASGAGAITLGVGWLICGAAVYFVSARIQRWWPFMLATLLVFALPTGASAATPGWANWNTARVNSIQGYPVFTVDGKPFFVYAAAFFYERIPRDRWLDTLRAYKALGINTIDLYLIWNWHEPSEGATDFSGSTDPRRDLAGLLKLTHQLGFKLIVRPGPVIRNEWRNGGYPDWLLERAPYNMPLHDVLEGRYPATATLQNHDADAAASEWLANETHLRSSAQWLSDALHAVEPYSHDVIAIALDDDQGAYLDNNTWPAPHWHAYIEWLRATVASIAGSKVPLFLNTYEMKVPSASPVWAWGNWYQGNSFRIGDHDLGDLDFATGLLQTQVRLPVMQSEFQAGWFQTADDGAPRPSDPGNTALALGELLRDGVHGIVNFPVQDTIYPHGWEAPWANWSYAWDAALTSDLHASARYAPTRALGEAVRAYGALLAQTHVAADAAIIWPPTLFPPGTLSNGDFAALAGATIAMQRGCNARGLNCTLVDLATRSDRSLRPTVLLLPEVGQLVHRMQPAAIARLRALQKSRALLFDVASVRVRARYARAPNVTLLLADNASYGFIVAINPSAKTRRIALGAVRLAGRSVAVAPFELRAGGARVVPIGTAAIAAAPLPTPAARGARPPFRDPEGTVIANAHLRVVFAPFAGARIAELDDAEGNAASSIGLLRDAIDPMPPASARDYIASYTHPLPAGTFNRSYACTRNDAFTTIHISCSYDAPDLPQGGAVFSRELRLGVGSDEMIVGEEFVPHDTRTTERLESVSGFALAPGDSVLAPSGSNGVGILHGQRLTFLRWRAGDVARVDLRRTRGAEIVTLVFARRSVEMRLGLRAVRDAAEARALLGANQR
jgi:hypothetical protein